MITPANSTGAALIAQLHREIQASTPVLERRAVEARRPEGRGGIVGEAVALLRLAEQAGFHLRLVVLRVEHRDRIGPGRKPVENTRGQAVLDLRDRAAQFVSGLAKTGRRGIEPAAHGPLSLRTPMTETVSFPDGSAFAPAQCQARERRRAPQPNRMDASDFLRSHDLSLGLVEGEPEAEQRQTHIDRLLVGVLHGDFQLAPGSHGGDHLVGQRHRDEAPDIGAGLDRLPLGRAVVDLDRHRLGEIEPERQRQHHGAGLEHRPPAVPPPTAPVACVSRWNTCWTARQSSVLPSPVHSTRHAAGGPSGACAGAECETAAITTASPAVAAISMTRLPAGAARRLARMV